MARDVSTRQPLAHSAARDGLSGDPYARHVASVCTGAKTRAEQMLAFADSAGTDLLLAIEAAARFHDLGKLDSDMQAILSGAHGGRPKWDHVDAGVAYLSRHNNWMASWLVRAHHAPGLPAKAKHFTERTDRRLRGRRWDDAALEDHDRQIAHVESHLADYASIHERVLGLSSVLPCKPKHGLTMRLALSCLVDADHADTAFHDSGFDAPAPVPCRWGERLRALCSYVEGLGTGSHSSARDDRRSDFFEACLRSSEVARIVSCEAPVGLGKTTAVTAYLLHRAHSESLRRLFVVAPYTCILSQTAERLRRALVLPGEDPERIVVEHHHRADFSQREDRELAVLWQAPVVVTTAVTFFETLAGCEPGTLRKLHSLPGSAIFIDECHAVLPPRLWAQNWGWLAELCDSWGCRAVLASGSLVRFWERPDIVRKPVVVPELTPSAMQAKLRRDEQRRVTYRSAKCGELVSVQQLVNMVCSTPGPRLLILNTVQNAAVVADAVRSAGGEVFHLSTALTPFDRSLALKRVKERLTLPVRPDWTLVATSCVEAGVDFSFRTAFRERFSVASVLQVAGRVNRNAEYDKVGGADVYDFVLSDKSTTVHPGASSSAEVLRLLLASDTLNDPEVSPAEIATMAAVKELQASGGLTEDALAKAESARDYPMVRQLGRVIDSDTRFVAVDGALVQMLKRRLPVGYRALLDGSVQIWASKIDKLGLMRLPGRREIYAWHDAYEPGFLGYMAGVLRNESFMHDNEAWVI